MKIQTTFSIVILTSLLASCVSVHDTEEYRALSSKNNDLSKRHTNLQKDHTELLNTDKGSIYQKFQKEVQKNASLSSQLNKLTTENTSLSKQHQATSNKLTATDTKLKNTESAFRRYVMRNIRSEIANEYMKNDGWYEVTLSDVKRLETEYSYKEVVYVKFHGYSSLYDGWYELGTLVSEYNLVKQTYGKSGVLGIIVLDKNGSEARLDSTN